MNTVFIITVITAVVSYLIGSVNFSILISKAISGKDIRESGSGNAGATNMLRTHGKKMAIITLLCDIAKGILAVLVAILGVKYLYPTAYVTPFRLNVMPDSYPLDTFYPGTNAGWLSFALPCIAGLFVMLGHCFPVFFGFKGGKGVATALGVVMTLDWKIGIIVLVIALALMAATRYVSLGSVVAAALFIVLTIVKMFISGSINPYIIISSALMGLLVIFRHHANIGRLIHGTENKLSFSSKESASPKEDK